jgi:hypothetical protein
LAELISNDPRDDVGAAAGWLRHDDGNRATWISLRARLVRQTKKTEKRKGDARSRRKSIEHSYHPPFDIFLD